MSVSSCMKCMREHPEVEKEIEQVFEEAWKAIDAAAMAKGVVLPAVAKERLVKWGKDHGLFTK